MHSIASFEKLNIEGMTSDAFALAELVEDILPAACGGTPADYQFAEEEDGEGLTRLVLSVSPSVPAGEAELKEMILMALRASKATLTPMSELIDRTGTIVVRREYPLATSTGKINPLRKDFC